MPSNNSKYTQEIREKTAKYILETGKSATSVAEEMGIGVDTVCRWVREYRRKYNLPSYAEEKGIKKKEPQTELRLHEPGSLQNEGDGTKSRIVGE
ncbi:MAG: transposase [Lachnospiraceae bacterium]|nr:transposase [Lachnospiraceae bacterium]